MNDQVEKVSRKGREEQRDRKVEKGEKRNTAGIEKTARVEKMGRVLITSRDFNGGFLYAVYFVHDLYYFEPVGSRVFGRKSSRRVALRVLN